MQQRAVGCIAKRSRDSGLLLPSCFSKLSRQRRESDDRDLKQNNSTQKKQAFLPPNPPRENSRLKHSQAGELIPFVTALSIAKFI